MNYKNIILLISLIVLTACDTKIKLQDMVIAKSNVACKDHGGVYAVYYVGDDDRVTCRDGYTTRWSGAYGADVLNELNKIEKKER